MPQLAARTKLSLVVAACLLALVILLKNVVSVSSDVLSRDYIVYAVVYVGFALFVPVQEAKQKATGLDGILLPALVVMLTTAAIVAFYAFAP